MFFSLANILTRFDRLSVTGRRGLVGERRSKENGKVTSCNVDSPSSSSGMGLSEAMKVQEVLSRILYRMLRHKGVIRCLRTVKRALKVFWCPSATWGLGRRTSSIIGLYGSNVFGMRGFSTTNEDLHTNEADESVMVSSSRDISIVIFGQSQRRAKGHNSCTTASLGLNWINLSSRM